MIDRAFIILAILAVFLSDHVERILDYCKVTCPYGYYFLIGFLTTNMIILAYIYSVSDNVDFVYKAF
jgi:hypothetical protein